MALTPEQRAAQQEWAGKHQALEETYEGAKQYVLTAIEGFKNDPPDSDFQRGYLAALETVLKEAFKVHTKGYQPFTSTE